jgi:fatty acid desaturase
VIDAIDARRAWLTTPRTWASAAHLALSWVAYMALAVAALHVPLPARLPIWFVMGWLLLGNGAVVHECIHRHLFAARGAHRWVGTAAGLTVLLPFGVYRPYHLTHHRYTAAVDDPEGAPLDFRARWEFALLPLGGPVFLAQLIAWGVRSTVGRPPAWMRSAKHRRAGIIDSTLCIVAVAAVVVAAFVDAPMLLTVWLAPWLFTILVLVPFVLSTEHYGATTGTVEATENTRTVTTNALVRWAYWNNNFHTAHHQLPTVVHQGLAELDRSLGTDRGDWVATGYVAFHGRLWRRLPWSVRSSETV